MSGTRSACVTIAVSVGDGHRASFAVRAAGLRLGSAAGSEPGSESSRVFGPISMIRNSSALAMGPPDELARNLDESRGEERQVSVVENAVVDRRANRGGEEAENERGGE